MYVRTQSKVLHACLTPMHHTILEITVAGICNSTRMHAHTNTDTIPHTYVHTFTVLYTCHRHTNTRYANRVSRQQTTHCEVYSHNQVDLAASSDVVHKGMSGACPAHQNTTQHMKQYNLLMTILSFDSQYMYTFVTAIQWQVLLWEWTERTEQQSAHLTTSKFSMPELVYLPFFFACFVGLTRERLRTVPPL